MNPEERRPSSSLPEVAESANANRSNGDDEFGDFEESEDVAIGNVSAAAAGPSPWATFPDLLPVQTSPANASDEVASSSQAADQESQPWLVNVSGPSVASGSGASAPSPLCVAASFASVSPRTGNPPDISIISACGVSSSSSNFNGLDPVSGDPLQPSIVSSSGATGRHQFESVALASELRQQIDALASQRSHLEQQLAWVSRENDRLSGELAASNRRAVELQTQLEESQEQARNNQSSQASASWNGSADNSSQLAQIQKTLMEIQNSQTENRENLHQLRHNFETLTNSMDNRMQAISDNLSKKCSETMDCFTQTTVECTQQMQKAIQTTLENCMKNQGERVAASMMETMRKEFLGQPSLQNDGVMAQFKADMESFVNENRRILERERRNHLTSLSRALQSALTQLSSSINSIDSEINQEEKEDQPNKSS